jgi:hypothetical protein
VHGGDGEGARPVRVVFDATAGDCRLAGGSFAVVGGFAAGEGMKGDESPAAAGLHGLRWASCPRPAYGKGRERSFVLGMATGVRLVRWTRSLAAGRRAGRWMGIGRLPSVVLLRYTFIGPMMR